MNKPKDIYFRLKPDEYELFLKNFRETTYQYQSQYIVRLVLGRPIKVYYRDRAFDEFTEAAVQFHKQAARFLDSVDGDAESVSKLVKDIDYIKDITNKIYSYVRLHKKTRKHPRGSDVPRSKGRR